MPIHFLNGLLVMLQESMVYRMHLKEHLNDLYQFVNLLVLLELLHQYAGFMIVLNDIHINEISNIIICLNEIYISILSIEIEELFGLDDEVCHE